MAAIRGGAVAVLVGWLTVAAAQAQNPAFGALARLIPAESRIEGDGSTVMVTLALSQPVPFRVVPLADPARIVLDFREVDFGDWAAVQADLPDGIAALSAGPARQAGWSRLVIDLSGPMIPDVAGMTADPVTGRARLTLHLVATDAATLRARAGTLPEAAAPVATLPEPARRPRGGRITVVLDPGHGGIDPGAVRGPHSEADLVLTFGRELRDALRRTGRIDVVMTREADAFVPLPVRLTLARAARADLLISIHADALAEGRARGATVYTLSDTASDAAAAALAERHDRADLVQGVDLNGADDVVAGVLMDLARLQTASRSAAFAQALVDGIGAAGLGLHARPLGQADFTVLRAADMPSVLFEIGFLSDERDLANILDPGWRAAMQAAVVRAVLDWADADALRMARARR